MGASAPGGGQSESVKPVWGRREVKKLREQAGEGKNRRVQRRHTFTPPHPPRRPVLIGQSQLTVPRPGDKPF